MVATSIHFLIGVTLAWFLGYKDNRKYLLGLVAALPDIDGLILALLLLGKSLFGFSLGFIDASEFWTIVLAHRGISHSFLFVVAGLCVLRLCKVHSRMIATIGILWCSHLFTDYISAWKLFPFLPFSYAPFYLGIVEVFDSLLVLFTFMLMSLFIGITLMKQESKKYPIFVYGFVFALGLIPAFVTGEFTWLTLGLCHGFLLLVVGAAFLDKKRKYMDLLVKGVTVVSIVLVTYLALLFAGQVVYSFQVGAPLYSLEPFEEFAFNGNAHTFEIPIEDEYRIGLVSWKGIEQDFFIDRVNDYTPGLDEQVKQAYFDAYEKAIFVNWFNHPVWSFYEDESGTVYANIRYAKSFLDTEVMTGPRDGLNITLQNGRITDYGEGWFD